MSKKIISVMLLAAMCCMMLISCGKTVLGEASDYIDSHPLVTERERVTINFYMISDIALSDVAIEEMERSFNIIIESKYNTHVEFVFATEDEYAQLVASKMQSTKDVRENLANGTLPEPGKTDASNTAYPAVLDSQFDIFLSTGEQEFLGYVKAGDVVNLTSYISKNYRSFSDGNRTADVGGVTYHPTVSEVIFSNSYFLENVFDNSASAKPNSTTKDFYGIPCTYVIDSYDYLFVNQDYADQFYMGSFFPEDAVATRSQVENYAKTLAEELKNVVNPDDISNNYIISKTNATYEERFNYSEEDFYRCILRKPQTLYRDICSAMFCVSSYTANAERSYEVLYELYTNPELHSILQYGVKNVTYSYDPLSQTVSLIDDAPYEYSVDLRYTGNMFCLYPCEDLEGAESYQALEYAYQQNKDANPPAITPNNHYVLQTNMLTYLRDLYTVSVGSEAPLTSDNGGYEDGAYSYAVLATLPSVLIDAVEGNPQNVEARIICGEYTGGTYYGYIVTMDDAVYRFFAFPADGSANFRMSFTSERNSFNSNLLTSMPITGDLQLNNFTLIGTVENEQTGATTEVDAKSNIRVAVSSFNAEEGELTMTGQDTVLDIDYVKATYLDVCKNTLCDYLNIWQVLFADSGVLLSDMGFVRY